MGVLRLRTPYTASPAKHPLTGKFWTFKNHDSILSLDFEQPAVFNIFAFDDLFYSPIWSVLFDTIQGNKEKLVYREGKGE